LHALDTGKYRRPLKENSAAQTGMPVGSEKPIDEAIEWQLLAHCEIGGSGKIDRNQEKADRAVAAAGPTRSRLTLGGH
jgi:hypothetical protein